jgi:hypothetical protein
MLSAFVHAAGRGGPLGRRVDGVELGPDLPRMEHYFSIQHNSSGFASVLDMTGWGS